jgi:hypothetical protein
MSRPEPESAPSPFVKWAARWMAVARYPGRNVPDPDGRIEQVHGLWQEEIPEGWGRDLDRRLVDPAIRYLRTHKQGSPRPGSEHELEHQVLEHSPTCCLGGTLLDGINAVPLARDQDGGRAGNVEADMLLLTQHEGQARLVLVEAKTTSNNAWFAAVENLRQLRLFLAGKVGQSLFLERQRDLEHHPPLPVTALVLGPPAFYDSDGQKRNSVTRALRLLHSVNTAFRLDCRLATWSATTRQVATLEWPD